MVHFLIITIAIIIIYNFCTETSPSVLLKSPTFLKSFEAKS